MNESLEQQIKELYVQSGFSYEDEIAELLSKTWTLHHLSPVKKTCKAPHIGAGDVDLITYLKEDGWGVEQKILFMWQCKRASSKIFLFDKDGQTDQYKPISSIEVDKNNNIVRKGRMPKKNNDLIHGLEQLRGARKSDDTRQSFCRKVDIALNEINHMRWVLVSDAELRTKEGESIKPSFIKVEYGGDYYYVCKGGVGVKDLVIHECNQKL